MRQDQFGHDVNANYTFVPITVAGVTFKNGRRSRQTILRAIYWKDDPYRSVESIELIPTSFNNEPAVEIWVSSKKARELIGYVPKKEASYVHSHMNYYHGYFSFEVYGGGNAPDGTKLSYGASLTLRFLNDPSAILTPDIPTDAELETQKSIEAAQRALDYCKKPISSTPIASEANETIKAKKDDQTTHKRKPERNKMNYLFWFVLFLVILFFCFFPRFWSYGFFK